MKKVAILTINSQNYGNRLQNYALQMAIEKYGYTVETLKRDRLSGIQKLKNMVRPILKPDKMAGFIAFDTRIRWSQYTVSQSFVSRGLNDKYDLFIIGSDQVWNPMFYFNGDNDFLPMVDLNKKASYAASFGISEIPAGKKAHIRDLLADIPLISVREESGAAIVKELTGKEVPVVLDPTLLLSKEEWIQCERKPRMNLEAKYIVKYMLGEDIYSDDIQNIAKERGWGIVDVTRDDLPIGPAEFIYLLHHGELICTDSFHASLFAFLFGKPLMILERDTKEGDMSSRIDTLVTTFRLQEHRRNFREFSIEKAFSDDYAVGYCVLNKRRRESEEILRKILSNGE